MFAMLLEIGTEQRSPIPKEGDLFKLINIHGTTFEIRYGYYEERDRYARKAQPVEIYPNFAENPQYTDEGVPFATEMQIPCEYYKGKKDENSACGDCAYYLHCEELMGICTCPMKKRESGGQI